MIATYDHQFAYDADPEAIAREVYRTFALTPPACLDDPMGRLPNVVHLVVQPGDMTRYDVVITYCADRGDAPYLVTVVGMGSYWFNAEPDMGLPHHAYIVGSLRLRGTSGPIAVAEYVRAALYRMTTDTFLTDPTA